MRTSYPSYFYVFWFSNAYKSALMYNGNISPCPQQNNYLQSQLFPCWQQLFHFLFTVNRIWTRLKKGTESKLNYHYLSKFLSWTCSHKSAEWSVFPVVLEQDYFWTRFTNWTVPAAEMWLSSSKINKDTMRPWPTIGFWKMRKGGKSVSWWCSKFF